MTSNAHRYKSLVDKSLTANGNGWKLDLFPSIADDYICAQCLNICKNAVSLVCNFGEEDEHKDEEIKLYCESCLKKVIYDNENRCPISGHSNPKYMASRIPRKQIMKAYVLCPNSLKYQCSIKNNKNTSSNRNTDNICFSSGNFYTNEGREKPSAGMQGCTNFKGNLGSLIEEHIYGCIEHQLKNNKTGVNASQMNFQMIEDLFQEIALLKNIQRVKNKEMKEEIQELKNNVNLMQQQFLSMQKMQETKQNEMKVDVDSNENILMPMRDQETTESYLDKFVQQPLLQIPLSVHSCRKFYSDYYPEYLLQSGTATRYMSAYNSDFAVNEKDWIVLKMENVDQAFLPTQIKILNWSNTCAISRIKVYIGSVINDDWHKLHTQNGITDIEMQSKTLQTFELDGYQSLMRILNQKEDQWNYIKVHFIANHGGTSVRKCKFICYEIQFHGKCIE